ncbi:MAG: methylenetetrahydrofolate reductase C-terminal domain-containing protein [Desulfobacteraceae bacterium]|jgi:ferredoxin
MIRSITRQKPEEEIDRLLEGLTRIFVVGCGTCATLTRTGGAEEVRAMAESLAGKGKLITGEMVLPVACDNLTGEILETYGAQFHQSDALLIMSCAFGVQTLARQVGKLVIPALDTLFVGKEAGVGRFDEICTQCGSCILGETGGICPVTACHKGLVNGPCGGTQDGKCEIGDGRDCAWTLIYNRLAELGRLDLIRPLQRPRNHQSAPMPGVWRGMEEEA